MADMGNCGECGKRSNLTHKCSACGTKLCTACRTKAGQTGKCPSCGKAGAIKSNT